MLAFQKIIRANFSKILKKQSPTKKFGIERVHGNKVKKRVLNFATF